VIVERWSRPILVSLAALVLGGLGACSDGGGDGNAVRAASVERLANGELRVTWSASPESEEVVVYSGTDPSAIAHSAPVGTGGPDGSVTVAGLDPARRYYFAVVAGGSELITAERRVPLAGAVNFRDLGGYATSNGRHTRWGRVFRSDELNRLTDADLTTFSSLDLKLVWTGSPPWTPPRSSTSRSTTPTTTSRR
jgi:protein-tyrosine phosphatase